MFPGVCRERDSTAVSHPAQASAGSSSCQDWDAAWTHAWEQAVVTGRQEDAADSGVVQGYGSLEDDVNEKGWMPR